MVRIVSMSLADQNSQMTIKSYFEGHYVLLKSTVCRNSRLWTERMCLLISLNFSPPATF